MLAADATPHPAQRSRSIFLALNERIAITAVLLAGFALRLALFDHFAFHPDEAIYAFWALYGRHIDPLFLQIWPDKPPLFLWVLGRAFDLFGATPLGARVPNILFSTLSIAVVVALARQWWGSRAGLVAGLLMALSPFAISFASTAFTDPLMVLAGLLAVYAAARRHPAWAGAWLGVAVMTKQQGLLFVPVVLAFVLQPLFQGQRSGQNTAQNTTQDSVQLLAGLLLIAAPILYWDSLRWGVAPSPWDLGAHNAGGFALSDPTTWLLRLADWTALSRHLFGDPLSWLLLFAAMLAARRCNTGSLWNGIRPALILIVWSAAVLVLHIFSTVQVWDRYLLPLTPAVALLGGFCADWVIQSAQNRRTEVVTVFSKSPFQMAHVLSSSSSLPRLFLAAWLLLQTGPAVQAAQGRLPLGGDRGAYSGIEEAAVWLKERAETLPVVYHRTVGWHLHFHLFAPLQTGQIELRWTPSAVQLADNAAKMPHRPRYLIEADWSPERDLSLQLAARRLVAEPRLRIGRFTIYAIAERPSTAARWRVCRTPALPRIGWSTLMETPNRPVQSSTDSQLEATP